MDSAIMTNDRVASLLKREAERQQEITKKHNDKKLANAEHEQFNYFTQAFQNKFREIEGWLEEASQLSVKEVSFHFDKISREIHTLHKFVSESVVFLRGYDIRVCQQELQDLEARTRKLEDQLLPKKKFGFKSKRNTSKLQKENKNGFDLVDQVPKKTNIKFDDNFYGFKAQNNTTLHLPPDSLFKKDVTLEKLNNCVVRLDGAPSTLHMSALDDCVVLCGPVSTSIFAENCRNCTLVIVCQQLRLHSSVNCAVYLHVTSRAIIEDCKQIRVAEYNYSYPALKEDFEKACLDSSVNNWNKLDDFNWLVMDKQSPNWETMPEECKIHDWDAFLATH